MVMIILTKEVKDMIRKCNAIDLEDDMDTFPESDRDGRDDYQILADETSWILHKYEDENWLPHWDLVEAREILRRTKRGKIIPVDITTLKPIYDEWEIDRAMVLDGEVKRMKRLIKALESRGYYGKW